MTVKIDVISKATGISTPHLYNIFSGTVPPGKNACIKISKVTNIEWWKLMPMGPDELRSQIEKSMTE